MREELDDAIEQGILTPAVDLRMNDDEEDSFKKGLVFEKSQEILTRGHTVMLSSRIEKVKERAEFSDYLLIPTKSKLEKVVRTVVALPSSTSFLTVSSVLEENLRSQRTSSRCFRLTWRSPSASSWM